jgi:predicted patatin/cPLA2 family phospholipase
MLKFCQEAGGQVVTIAASETDSQNEHTRTVFFIVESWFVDLEQIARLIDLRQVVFRADANS